MSGDEVLVTLVSVILGAGGWVLWIFRASSIDTLRRGRSSVVLLASTLGGLGLVIFAFLRFCAADDVREAPAYLFMYFMLGLAWMRLVAAVFPLAGLHPRDDIIERRNAAARPAWIGAMVGVAFCYSFANVGNGPGWWAVVFSAALATAGLGAVWIVFAQATGAGDAVAIDRDRAAGVRLGGLLAACGLIFGAAVMGDWVSAPATIADFVTRAWTSLPLAFIAAVIERPMRPRPDRPIAPLMVGGVLPALLYGILACAAVTMPELPAW